MGLTGLFGYTLETDPVGQPPCDNGDEHGSPRNPWTPPSLPRRPAPGEKGGCHEECEIFAVVSAASLSAGLLALAPAQAGATWSGPSEVSSKFGRTVVVSDGGRVAAWVRTNKTSSSASGPIRTAWYLKKKKKWTSSAPIPGASESTNVQLSNDGNAALIESGTTGYLMSVRDTKNTWLTAQSIVSGMDLGSGVMSGDAKTLVYVDWGVRTTTRRRLGSCTS